jgi:hypothetical protein
MVSGCSPSEKCRVFAFVAEFGFIVFFFDHDLPLSFIAIAAKAGHSFKNEILFEI